MDKHIEKLLKLRNQMASAPKFRYGEFTDGAVFFTDGMTVIITDEIEPLTGFKSEPMSAKIVKDLLEKAIANSKGEHLYHLPTKTDIKKATAAHRKLVDDKIHVAYDFTGCGKCCVNPGFLINGMDATDSRDVWCYSHKEPLLMASYDYKTYALILPVNILATQKDLIFTIDK